MYKLTAGIEHLMTGLQLMGKEGSTQMFHFACESPSIVSITSDKPFDSYWPVNQAFQQAQEQSGNLQQTRYSHGEAEWWGQVVAPAMADCNNRSYDMQIYAREVGKYSRVEGNTIVRTRYAPGEPNRFPVQVVTAMRRKHGKDADKYLSQLLWDRDHWYYTKDGMYIGVEPDGYIHT